MINQLKAAIVAMDLDEFERAINQLEEMNLQDLSYDELQECYELIEQASRLLIAQRSQDLAKLSALEKSATYIQQDF